ncbi:MAG TPA: bifunctional [glutamate--ammonia ligase]-adenylyl-L-tyrosine phosphorylase/[glutamate--ammonia-ligase] adenylyltransferase [Pseudomonadales bacterium]|nr:bifunctional [glutamate--ammonia ligase]-adenylyl-L-tyrosine phosphorylase/[glutamate--ammonia-ligase] adenylyltransferase [Pseudomonadales bacterium]
MNPPIDFLPAALQAVVLRHWQRLDDATMQRYLALPPARLERLLRVWAVSDFVADCCVTQPMLALELEASGDLDRDYPSGMYQAQAKQLLTVVDSEAALMQQLRRWRRREMVRIACRDRCRLADFVTTSRELSALAEAAVDVALGWLYQDGCRSHGVPTGRHTGREAVMVVLGMGKLGGGELNFSSDIDLIFACSEAGETRGGPQSIDNGRFFTRLGQRLINVLDRATDEGSVFRVDMRLRPYGQSGALVPSFDAMESYYQEQGRVWERYAMLKARVIAGAPAAAADLMARLTPFVYRRYLDFSVIGALRELKAMIQREVREKGLEQNLKLGSGGIREVEFIVQALQLSHGGRDPRLRQTGLLAALGQIAEGGHLPQPTVAALREAYLFLRDSEHVLQELDDRQTQNLPTGEAERERVAFAMGFADWSGFQQRLTEYRETVHRHFNEMVSEPEAKSALPVPEGSGWLKLWRGELAEDQAARWLGEQGLQQPQALMQRIAQLRSEPRVAALRDEARARLDRLLPMLLADIARHATPQVALERVLTVIEALLRRTVYLVLLTENPSALHHLIDLCALSPWITDLISRFPSLLDEFLDAQNLYAPPERQAVQEALNLRLLRIPEDDLEAQMEGLRYFKQAHLLKVAAAEMAQRIPLMKASDYLTFIAEAVLVQVFNLAWRHLTRKHGVPQRAPGVACNPDFIIVGYGKLGGIELSYSSDLDLVFIHDAAPNLTTDGDQPIDNGLFFSRLVARMMHILTAVTPSGQLYEVDIRLRPSGRSGVLVSSLNAFRGYQLEDAWTWEHQALVRARVVAGCHRLRQKFEQVRAEVLGRPRDLPTLRDEVAKMRGRMVEELGSVDRHQAIDEAALFDLKQDPGGIVDIEFLAQYGVLAWSADHPQLLQFTDTIRILDGLEEAALLGADEARQLRDHYRSYRTSTHRLALMKEPQVVPAAPWRDARRQVAAIWQRLLVPPAA